MCSFTGDGDVSLNTSGEDDRDSDNESPPMSSYGEEHTHSSHYVPGFYGQWGRGPRPLVKFLEFLNSNNKSWLMHTPG